MSELVFNNNHSLTRINEDTINLDIRFQSIPYDTFNTIAFKSATNAYVVLY